MQYKISYNIVETRQQAEKPGGFVSCHRTHRNLKLFMNMHPATAGYWTITDSWNAPFSNTRMGAGHWKKWTAISTSASTTPTA